MKKFTRILTLALVLVMVCSLLPMGAMAATNVLTSTYIFEDAAGKMMETIFTQIDLGTTAAGTTLSPDTLNQHTDGELYDLVGMYVVPDLSTMTDKEIEEYLKKFNEYLVANGVTSVTIPAYPTSGTQAEKDAWNKKWGEILVNYAPHKHRLSCWITDTTNHWKNCLVCKEQFLMMDWHHDYDEDKVCDFCGDAIVYYDITIEEVEGAKLVELEGDTDMTAAYRDVLTVEFEAADGYELVGVRFYKVREDGTESELTRKVITRGELYGVDMPSFDIRIVPEVVKAN